MGRSSTFRNRSIVSVASIVSIMSVSIISIVLVVPIVFIITQKSPLYYPTPDEPVQLSNALLGIVVKPAITDAVCSVAVWERRKTEVTL